jgi:hypothetical protein
MKTFYTSFQQDHIMNGSDHVLPVSENKMSEEKNNLNKKSLIYKMARMCVKFDSEHCFNDWDHLIGSAV